VLFGCCLILFASTMTGFLHQLTDCPGISSFLGRGVWLSDPAVQFWPDFY